MGTTVTVISFDSLSPDSDWSIADYYGTVVASRAVPNGVSVAPEAAPTYGPFPVNITFPADVADGGVGAFFAPVGDYNDANTTRQGYFIFRTWTTEPWAARLTISMTPDWAGLDSNTVSQIDNNLFWTQAALAFKTGVYGLRAYNDTSLVDITLDWGDGTAPEVLPAGDETFNSVSHVYRNAASHTSINSIQNVAIRITLRDSVGRTTQYRSGIGGTISGLRIDRFLAGTVDEIEDCLFTITHPISAFAMSSTLYQLRGATLAQRPTTGLPFYNHALWKEADATLSILGRSSDFGWNVSISADNGRSYGYPPVNNILFPGGFPTRERFNNAYGLLDGGVAAVSIRRDGPYNDYATSLWFTRRQSDRTYSEALKITDLDTNQGNGAVLINQPVEAAYIWQLPDGRLVVTDGRRYIYQSQDFGRMWNTPAPMALSPSLFDNSFRYVHAAQFLDKGMLVTGVKIEGTFPDLAYSLWFTHAQDWEAGDFAPIAEIAALANQEPFGAWQTNNGNLIATNGRDVFYQSFDLGRTWETLAVTTP